MGLYRKWIQSTVLLLGVGLASAGVFAQQAGQTAVSQAPQVSTQSASTDTTGKLNLTPEQKKQLRELHLRRREAEARHAAELAPLTAARDDAQTALRAQMTAANEPALLERRRALLAQTAAAEPVETNALPAVARPKSK